MALGNLPGFHCSKGQHASECPFFLWNETDSTRKRDLIPAGSISICLFLAAPTWQAGILLINELNKFKMLRNPSFHRCQFTATDFDRGILFAGYI